MKNYRDFLEIFIPALLVTAGGYGAMIAMCHFIAYTAIV